MIILLRELLYRRTVRSLTRCEKWIDTAAPTLDGWLSSQALSLRPTDGENTNDDFTDNSAVRNRRPDQAQSSGSVIGSVLPQE